MCWVLVLTDKRDPNFIKPLLATSLQDELIVPKYASWPEDADWGQVWFWLFLTIVVESERYELDPQAVIVTEFKAKPYGEFVIENYNNQGFCEIPWHSITTYTASGGQELADVKTFTDTWDCAYR